MTLEDPFFVVKDEVFKALNKTRGLYLRWQEILKYPSSPVSPELEWISTELRNALRSIEWDLEDLEDTISIVERNSTKFKIDNKELSNRRSFIETTRQEVKTIKNMMHLNRSIDDECTVKLLEDESPPKFTVPWGSAQNYSVLSNQTDSPTRFDGSYNVDDLVMQDRMLMGQNEQLEALSSTVGVLNNVSRNIGLELDEHAVMLDDMSTELENAGSKLDSNLKKIAKVLHMNNDRRQWCAIGTLIGIIFIIVILLVII